MRDGKVSRYPDCELQYENKWRDANMHHTLSQEAWREWFDNHCQVCCYMCEVCMYGEGLED